MPEEVHDSAQDQTWPKGWNHIEGNLALKYVRQRHGLAEGDFGRIDRQQNFLRALMGKVLEDGTIGNPVKFTNTLDAITSQLTVDQSWSSGDLRGLALGMRNLNSDHVRFVTLPLDHYETVEGAGSVNIIDETRAKEMWRAVTDDSMGRYLEQHPEDELGDPEEVG